MPRVALAGLAPAWEAVEGRQRMGFSMDCPRHPGCHRVALWFENPEDGGTPRAGVEAQHLVTVLVDELELLTVVPAGGYPPDGCVQIGHWVGWLANGQLTEALISGVAW